MLTAVVNRKFYQEKKGNRNGEQVGRKKIIKNNVLRQRQYYQSIVDSSKGLSCQSLQTSPEMELCEPVVRPRKVDREPQLQKNKIRKWECERKHTLL